MASGNTLLTFDPKANQPPATNYATLDDRNNQPSLDFDDTVNEDAVFGDVMPQQYNGGGVTVFLHFAMTSAIILTVDLDVAFERIGEVQDVDSDGFASAKSVDNTTVPGTAGIVEIVSIAFLNSEIDGILIGEEFRIKVTRDAVSDDAVGDLELRKVEIRET